VDTARIHRADTAVQMSAKSRVAHYPLYAHAHSYPPRHRGSWVFAIIMLTAMTGITAYFLPAEVNSWAYVVGAENQDTFHPVDYRDSCTGVPRGGGSAIASIAGGLFFNGVALLLLYVLVVLTRHTSSRRGRRVPAGAGPHP